MQKKADNGEKIVSSANGPETLVYPYAKKNEPWSIPLTTYKNYLKRDQRQM